MSQWNYYNQNVPYNDDNNHNKRKKRKNKGNKRYDNNYNDEYQESRKKKEKSISSNYDKDGFEYLKIDGSMMEGGGQLLRNSVTLSALLSQPVYIINIRKKRTKPGLRQQHSKGIELVKQINGGYVEGNHVKSMEVKYYPKPEQQYFTDFMIDIETAGACCLLIQTALPLLLYSPQPCTLITIGGTNASFAPQIDYVILVLQPMLKRLMNIEIDVQCIQRGFYPRGGGKVLLKTKPIKGYIPSFHLTKRGKIINFHGSVIIAGRNTSLYIGNHIVKGAVRELQRRFGNNIPIKIDVLSQDKLALDSDGTGIVIVGETDTGCLFGGSCLGKQGYDNEDHINKYEEIGSFAAMELIQDWDSTKQGCTDRWLQDQLIIFMALAQGKSTMYTCVLQLHTQTAIYIAELMTGAKFECSQINDGTVLIECQGIGYKGCVQENNGDNNVENEKAEKKENDKPDASNYLLNRPSLF